MGIPGGEAWEKKDQKITWTNDGQQLPRSDVGHECAKSRKLNEPNYDNTERAIPQHTIIKPREVKGKKQSWKLQGDNDSSRSSEQHYNQTWSCLRNNGVQKGVEWHKILKGKNLSTELCFQGERSQKIEDWEFVASRPTGRPCSRRDVAPGDNTNLKEGLGRAGNSTRTNRKARIKCFFSFFS